MSSRLLSITLASAWVMVSPAEKTGAPFSSLLPWMAPAFRAAETKPLAQTGMAPSSAKPVSCTPSSAPLPRASMAMARNSERVTVSSGSKNQEEPTCRPT